MQQTAELICAAVDSLRGELLEFLQRLVQIPSLPGNEQQVQSVVAEKLRGLGLSVDVVHSRLHELERHPAFCDDGVPFHDRLNVVGRWSATGPALATPTSSEGSLILNGHVDVVPTGDEALWSDSPWGGKISDGKLYGRGACDMKAGLTAAIFSIQALQKLNFHGRNDVLIQSVIGEETGGVGTLTMITKGYSADAAVLVEPTGLEVCPVQAGALTFRIKIQGHACHASMKQRGVSAIEKFVSIFERIEQLDHQRHLSHQNPMYENPLNIAPINIGTVNAGVWHSTVPDELVVEGRYGVFPGESLNAARASLTSALDEVTANDPWLKDHPPIIEWFEGQFESGQTMIDEAAVQALVQCHAAVIERVPELRGVPYGSDLRLFTNHAGIPAILYGPGNVFQAHAIDEYVPVEDVVNCTKVLAEMIRKWCGGEIDM